MGIARARHKHIERGRRIRLLFRVGHTDRVNDSAWHRCCAQGFRQYRKAAIATRIVPEPLRSSRKSAKEESDADAQWPCITFEETGHPRKWELDDGEFKVRSAFNESFLQISRISSELVGSPWTFLIAIFLIVAWAITGFLVGFSEDWLLVIHMTIAVTTFLIVILIQSAQNRELKALQLKLDELIKSSEGARNGLVNLQELSDEELEFLQKEFQRLRLTNDHGAATENVRSRAE
jgi:low affinity Fe/Cu permease